MDVPDGGSGMGVGGLVKRLLFRFLAWVVRDTASRVTAEYHDFNTTPGNNGHTLSFDALADKPFAVTARRLSNGVPVLVKQWLCVPGDVDKGRLRIDWNDPGTNGIRLEVTSSYTDRPADTVATGAVAADEEPPTATFSVVDVADGVLEVDDGVRLRVEPDDNRSPDSQIRVFAGYDRLEDGDPFNDVYRPLAGGAALPGGGGAMRYEVPVPSLDSQPLTVVAVDGAGTPRVVPAPAQPPIDAEAPDCPQFTQEQTQLRTAIDQAVLAAYASPWVIPVMPAQPLGPHADRIRFILEQGSGACIWMQQICDACEGVFNPKSSDHDYEVFLPVFSSYNAVPGYQASAPYALGNVTGDWYFKKPDIEINGNVTNLVYRLRAGTPPQDIHRVVVPITDGDTNKTPANYVSELMQDAGAAYLESQGRSFTAKNLTMFAARAEHFTNGITDLELPLESGADPLGDVGTGRQMLLLKWIVEGAYVPGYDGPDLATVIYPAFALQGVPQLEAHEWGMYHEFAALGTGAMLRTGPVSGAARAEPPAHDYLYEVRKKQLKSVGKAAIRATLAAMVGAQITNAYMVSPADYAANGYRGFEDMIAKRAQIVAATNSTIFAPATAADILQFYQAKVAQTNFMVPMLTPGNEAAADRFIATAILMLRGIQTRTKPAYDNAMALLQASSADEHAARLRNMGKILNGVPTAGKPGLNQLRTLQAVDLTLRLRNDGPIAASGVSVVVIDNGAQSVPFQVPLGADAEEQFKGSNGKGVDVFVSAPVPTSGLLTFQAFARSDSGGWKEPYNTNNWFGFKYYILDLNAPTPPGGLYTPVPPPAGLPAEDPNCRVNTAFK